MSIEILDIFKEFKVEKLLVWCKEIILFFIKPKKYVNLIKVRKTIDIIPQFIFYFIIYCISYLLISSATAFNELIKPAFLNFTTVIPTFILLCLSNWIATRNFYFKETFIFYVSIHLFISPIVFTLYSLYLNTESYEYKLLSNIINLLVALITIFYYGFAIQESFLRGLKIILVNYFLLNLIWLGMNRINFDEYGGQNNLILSDPIFFEYISNVEKLTNKEIIPTTRLVVTFQNDINITFLVQDIINDKQSKGGTNDNKLYKKEIENNLKFLQEQNTKIKFERNKVIFNLWCDYYNKINNEINYKVTDIGELENKGYKEVIFDKNKDYRGFIMPVDFGEIISHQITLKKYNNNIIKSQRISNYPNVLSENIIFFLGKLLDYLFFIIFDEGKPKPYKEVFEIYENVS